MLAKKYSKANFTLALYIFIGLAAASFIFGLLE
jgi:hypothetical protein